MFLWFRDILDFGFLTAIPAVSSDEDDIGEIYRESEYREHATSYPCQITPKPVREKGESPFKAAEIESSVSEADLYVYQGLFRVFFDVHFWVPGPNK